MRGDVARAADLHGLAARGGAGDLPRRSGRGLRALLRHPRPGPDPAAGGPRHRPRLVRRPHDAGARERAATCWPRALDAALADLERRYGTDRSKWRWGAAHYAYRRASAVRRRSPASAASSTSRCRAPATPTRSTAARWSSARTRRSPTGTRSSYRAIYDFADLDRSLYIHTTGQSGNPFSPFYRSFAERWAKVEYIEIATKRDGIAKAAIGTWKLTPQWRFPCHASLGERQVTSGCQAIGLPLTPTSPEGGERESGQACLARGRAVEPRSSLTNRGGCHAHHIGLTASPLPPVACSRPRRPRPRPARTSSPPRARSAAQLSDASRERRAQDSAIANWSQARPRHLRLLLSLLAARGREAGRMRRRRQRQALHRQRQALQPVCELSSRNLREAKSAARPTVSRPNLGPG